MTFFKCKVGDKVWSFSSGFGVITRNYSRLTYPICVLFEDQVSETFNYSGRSSSVDKYPTLFWDEVVFEVPSKPLPKLEVDTKLIVWHKDSPSVKYKRYFSHFSEDGRINVFCMGATSFSADCASATTCVWNEYEVVE